MESQHYGVNDPSVGISSSGTSNSLPENRETTPPRMGTGMPGSVDQAKQASGQVVDQAKQTASQVVDQVKEQASARLSDQIGLASQGLQSASQALRSVGQELRGSDQQMVAQYADRVAEQVDHVASYLKDKDLDQVISDVEHFARRQPAIFIGGALTLGIIAARFLKSTPPDRGSEMRWTSDTGYTTAPRSGPMTGGMGSDLRHTA